MQVMGGQLVSELDRRRRFEGVYVENYDRLVGYALRRTRHQDDAADVVANTFLVAWRKLDEVPLGDKTAPWLYGVARKVLANQRRGQRRHDRLAARIRGDVARSWAIAERSDSDDLETPRVARAFECLNPDDREILALVAWEGLDRSELASALGCSRNAARIRLHRARKRFAAALEGPRDRTLGAPVNHSWKVVQEKIPAEVGGEEAL